jgi:hypothetical protein
MLKLSYILIMITEKILKLFAYYKREIIQYSLKTSVIWHTSFRKKIDFSNFNTEKDRLKSCHVYNWKVGTISLK